MMHYYETAHRETGDEFEKCWFCGEWYPIDELVDETCRGCQMAIWSHEGNGG